MNGPSKLGTRKAKAKDKSGAVNLLKEINVCGGIVASSMTRKGGGCFGFLSSNSSTKKPPPRRHEPAPWTPASAPALHRCGYSVRHANPSRSAHLQANSSKCDIVTSKKPEASKEGSRPRWKRMKPGKDEKRFDFDEVLGGKIGSCSATKPTTLKKSVSSVSAVAAREEKVEGTPTSVATPPVQDSVSPEVPSAASIATPTTVCFATGHMLTGVRDWRKCRPRGLLSVRGGGQQEVAKSHDATRVSSAPPPLVEASISWLPSDAVDAKNSLSSSYRVRRPNFPANGPEDADDMCRDDVLKFVLGTKDSVDHELRSFSSNYSDISGSPKPSTLFDFNSPSLESITSGTNTRRIPSLVDHDLYEFSPACSERTGSGKLSAFSHLDWPALESTPSSGINIQKTPTTGDSFSPFSLILESVAKSSKHKFEKHQQERRGHRCGFSRPKNSPSADYSLSNDNIIFLPSSSACIKQLTLPPIDMGQLVEVLGDVSFSPETATNLKRSPTSSPPLSFQFECPRISLSSVDLDHFQKPSCGKTFPSEEISVEEQTLSTNRISWREGLVSRMFEMGELDCSHWLSDYQYNCTCEEDDKLESVSDPKFGNETRDFVLHCDPQLISGSLGSSEFASETVIGKTETITPSVAQISCAESISTEKLQLSSSSDSDWTVYYKNHLFEG